MPPLFSRASFSFPLTSHRCHFLPSTKNTIITMSFSSSSSFSSQPKADQLQDEKLLQVLKYHNQTKHNFNKYARGPHGLDWANQPNPFRRYLSAPLLPPLLHLPTQTEPQKNSNPNQTQSQTAQQNNPDDPYVPPLYSSLFHSLPPPKPISHSTISQFFYDSLALSAWKSTGYSTWSLRVNPSSGNLHPTEAYIIAPQIESLSNSPFVAHYAPKEHSMELRAEIPSGFFPNFFPENSFLVGFSSIFWREAWKYGERAFRYCNHDIGHAIAAVTMAAASLGWDVKLLDGLGNVELKKLLGLEIFPEFEIPSRPVKGKFPEIEFEHPDCLLLVFPSGIGKQFDVNYKELSSAISEFSNLEWKGNPNLLSKQHVCWDIIYRTAEVVKKPLTIGDSFAIDPFKSSGVCGEGSYKDFTVREVVRKRRSAVDMDGVTAIPRDTFYQILLHCLPSGCGSEGKQRRQLALPFRALPWDAEVHAVLFVHRVTGLPAGLYFLVRNEDHFSELKNSTSSNFAWAKPEGCPDDLPLYELDKSLFDSKSSGSRLSEKLSCHQVCHIVNGFIILNVPYFGRVVQRLIKQKKKKSCSETGIYIRKRDVEVQ
jgi:SagB-type dehydrogenase family enzyme